MRLLAAVCALAAAVFGALGALSMKACADDLIRANDNTAQVVRVQSIYAEALRADAEATNGFLVGGLEDPTERAQYDAAMASVAATIAEAARAQPADGTALAALNTTMQSYAENVALARADNRQGLPIGAQYLKIASTDLRATAVPLIDALTSANADRARAEFDAAGRSLPMLLSGLAALVVMILTAVWLAQRTHRYLNPRLTTGIVGVLGGLVVGILVTSSIASDVSGVRANEFAGTLALTTMRSAAYDAKSLESLGLIARGQAAPYEASWAKADTSVKVQDTVLTQTSGVSDRSVSALLPSWQAYQTAHAAMRALDDKGEWDAAVAQATSRATGTPTAALAAFDATSGSALGDYQTALASRSLAPRTKALVAAGLLLLLGLAGAVLATRGIAQRVQEYR
jgi:hypothetical protein